MNDVAELTAAIMEVLPDSAERRRYALLQAAATIQSGACAKQGEPFTAQFAVFCAEDLLDEINKREHLEAKS